MDGAEQMGLDGSLSRLISLTLKQTLFRRDHVAACYRMVDYYGELIVDISQTTNNLLAITSSYQPFTQDHSPGKARPEQASHCH